MSSSFTYTTLKAALVSFTEDQGTEFASAVDTIIPLGEDQALRDLDLELFDVTATTAFSAATATLTKPAGFLALRTLHYTDADSKEQLLLSKSWEFVKDYWPTVATTTASPKYFADYSETQWVIAGTPSGTNAVTVRYVKRPTGLSASNATTWLGTNVGDLLFYACLAVSEQFLKADNRAGLWKQEYASRLTGARRELKLEKRMDYMPMTAVPQKERD